MILQSIPLRARARLTHSATTSTIRYLSTPPPTATRPKYVYTPPTPSTSSSAPSSSPAPAPATPTPYPHPEIIRSGDLKTPMPTDMPREDYASPLLFTTNMIGKFLKYLVYGGVLVVVATGLGLEGVHQYVEHICLAAPTHSSSSTPDNSFGWEESNDAWTGSSGGTHPSLGIQIRHLLRSAWICQNWGSGISGGSIGNASNSSVGHPEFVGTKGMIGRSKLESNSNSPSSQQQYSLPGQGSFVNKVDKGYELAEAYISQAILLATNNEKLGLEFPPELSLSREKYPSSVVVDQGSASSAAAVSSEKKQIAIDLLTRHADILERIGTSISLRRSRDIYERILRGTLGASSTAGRSGIAEEGRTLGLARKLGDLNVRLGDVEAGRGWMQWGLRRSGIADTGLQLARSQEKVDETLIKGRESGAGAGWFGGWFASTKPTRSEENQVLGLQHNSTPVPVVSDSLTLPTASLPPPVLRETISLLASYSTQLAFGGELKESLKYQSAGLRLIKSHYPSSNSSNATSSQWLTSPSSLLHSLFLLHRASLFSLHISEITYALTRSEADALQWLDTATHGSETVVSGLTSSSVPQVQELTSGFEGKHNIPESERKLIDPHVAVPIQFKSLEKRFREGKEGKVLDKPASLLLKDAQRTSGEGWNLMGILYEKASRRGRLRSSAKGLQENDKPIKFGTKSSSTTSSSTPTYLSPTDETRQLQETALECYDRAIQYNKLAFGDGKGEDGEGGNPELLGKDVGQAKTEAGRKAGEYWRGYLRVRRKLEEGIEHPKKV